MKRNILSLILVLALCLSLALSASAASDAHVYDNADLLTASEESRLHKALEKISQECDAQLVVYTAPSTEGPNIDDFADDIYDSLNLGYGSARDGVLLLISMSPRECNITSNGYAGKAIAGRQIDAILDAIVPDLSGGDYADACMIFAEECSYYLDGYTNGFPFDTGKNLVIALIVGLVIGLITALVLKSQLTSVRKNHQADVYVKPGSMKVTLRNDLYLYRNVTRTKKESSSSSGSSGSSRSSGSRSF